MQVTRTQQTLSWSWVRFQGRSTLYAAILQQLTIDRRHNAMVGISVEPLVVIEGLTPAAQVFSQTELIKCHSKSPININHIFICRLRHPTCPLSWSSVRKRLRAFSITAQGVCHTPNLPLSRLNLLYLIMVLESKLFQLCNGSCRHSFETHRTVCAFVCPSTVVRNEIRDIS